MFRKIFFILIGLLFLASPALATDFFLSLEMVNDGGDGTTGQDDGGADDAFKTFAQAKASIGVGGTCWIRRTSGSATAQVADITFNSGYAATPIVWIGWPRDALPITSATWTNGSTTVDIILPASMTWGTVCGRWVNGPDGFDYLITLVTDANTLTIDRPYAGTTVTLLNGAASIKADELPRGVVKPADPDNWDADPDDLPIIDFNDGDFQVLFSYASFLCLYNLEFKDSTDGEGIIRVYNGTGIVFNGCLFKQSTQNDYVVKVSQAMPNFNRCIFTGFGGSNNHVEVLIDRGGAVISNSAIYGMGVYGLRVNEAAVELENLNIGVEQANTSADISFGARTHIVPARDLKLGGTNGEVLINTSNGNITKLRSVNHNKVLGAYKEYFCDSMTIELAAVLGATPNKKLSDNVIELTPDTDSYYAFKDINYKYKVWESRKTYDAGTYNVKVWIYNDSGGVLNDTTFSDDICMRCRAEAGSYGDATTEYVSMPWIYSDEIDIAVPADPDAGGPLDAADDWDYLQCDSVVVDVSGSKIYCEILVSTYDAEADPIYIDPESSNP